MGKITKTLHKATFNSLSQCPSGRWESETGKSTEDQWPASFPVLDKRKWCTRLSSNFHSWKEKLQAIVLDSNAQLCFSLNSIPRASLFTVPNYGSCFRQTLAVRPRKNKLLFGETNRGIWGHVDFPAKERAFVGFGLLMIPPTYTTGLQKKGPTSCCLPWVAAFAFCSLINKQQ